ncbi:MAG: alpha/beta hydrolase fold protein [Planctomycetaceae bacterium]|nr:alpha/beta hydrolase fold protein [Planctomycetaceae bacterium]
MPRMIGNSEMAKLMDSVKSVVFSLTLLTSVFLDLHLADAQQNTKREKGGAAVGGKGKYATDNGLKLYYEIHGTLNGKSPPLILLHGGTSTIETSFGKVLPLLAKSRQVIALEQQGHGHTADIDRPFSFEQSADDTAALLQNLKIAKADFYGYSNGGSIAMQVAIRHPKLVRKLIVASAMFKNDGFIPGFREALRQATLESMPAEFREAYLKVAPNPQNIQAFHDKSVRRMLEFQDWRPEELQGINAPTMILIGDADIIRPEHAVEMFRLIPQSQLAILPGTDHLSLVNRTDILSVMLPQFLDSPAPRNR